MTRMFGNFDNTILGSVLDDYTGKTFLQLFDFPANPQIRQYITSMVVKVINENACLITIDDMI